MTTRRDFLRWAGVGAATGFVVGRVGFAQDNTVQSTDVDKAKRHDPSAVPFELGIASYTFRDFSLDQAIAMTARLGIKQLCLNPLHLPVNSKPAVIAQALAKAKAAGLDVYAGGVIDLNTPANINQAFEFAKAAGMRVIVGLPRPETLPLVNEKVKQYDIRVAIHNHGPDEKNFPTPSVVYKKIEGLDPRIGLCIDIGHTMRNGDDPSIAAEQVADRLFDVHMKDVTAATAAGRATEVGHGVIDIPQFLRTLLKIRYSGVVSFEYEKNGEDPLPGLAESIGYVRGALAAI